MRFTGEQLADRRGDLDRVLAELARGDAQRATSTPSRPTTSAGGATSTRVCDARRKAIRRRKADDPHAVRVDARREEVP